jgi:hypothetical protein
VVPELIFLALFGLIIIQKKPKSRKAGKNFSIPPGNNYSAFK